MLKQKTSQEIVQICQLLHTRNMLAAADGNVSVRLSDQEILITPSGVAKAFMDDSMMAVIDIQGKILHGKPSTERLLHLAIYQQCPLAKAVVHAHPPTAIAWSIARPEMTELPSDCLSEVILACGSIPLVDYARPGTTAMGTNLHPHLPHHRALILARHGAVCWGESLQEAYLGMERIEHSALILSKAVQLGGLSPLPASEVAALRALRVQLGEKLL